MPALREAIKESFGRLFPAELAAMPIPLAQQGSDSDRETGPELEANESEAVSDREGPQLSYQERLAKQFDADLSQLGPSATPHPSEHIHMDDEVALASKTGELTRKLLLLSNALSSIPAASIESERVFSVAGGFATKIRSQLSDSTLDRFSFAKTKFKNDLLRKINIYYLVFLTLTS